MRSLLIFLVGLAALVFGQPAGSQSPTRTVAPAPATHAPWSPRNANYDIEVRLDHAGRALSGRETIRWRNVTSRPTSELQFHLYWNAWRNEQSTWLREQRLGGASRPRADALGSTDISTLRFRRSAGPWVNGMPRMRFLAPDDANPDDRTVVAVSLDQPVGPQETVEVNLEWAARIPQPFARTGYIGNYYFIGQWFPKLGVLEDGGWNAHQFHEHTEFFADYGVYDVRITVPGTFVVGATGCAAAPAATPSCSTSSGVDNGDGTRTHQFHAEDVHDFAWTASPDFLDLSRRFEHDDLPPVQMRLLLQPERHELADRYFSIVASTLRLYGQWFGAYPYGHLTIVDPAFQSESDGMEYPTLITGRARWLARADVQVPEATTAHEAGHQWWYGMVGSNEFEHAWMDEGLNTYATARVLDEVLKQNHVELRFFGGFIPWSVPGVPFTRLDNDRLAGYRENAETDAPRTPTWRHWPATSRFISYNKTALWLHTLEQLIGWPTMQQVLATYFERWKFRHPRPEDFFAVVREVSGRDLGWLFQQVYQSSNTFDYAVQDLRSDRLEDRRHRTTVVVRRLGEATFPVEVSIAFEGGDQVTERWDGEERRIVYQYERPERAVSATVDPRHVLLLDVNVTNNSRTLSPAAGRASLKWSLAWATWLQQLLLTYGFFA